MRTKLGHFLAICSVHALIACTDPTGPAQETPEPSRLATLTGTVTNACGDPVPTAHVIVSSPDTTVGGTGPEGQYRLQVPSGKHLITAGADWSTNWNHQDSVLWYDSVMFEVTLDSGVVTRDIVLPFKSNADTVRFRSMAGVPIDSLQVGSFSTWMAVAHREQSADAQVAIRAIEQFTPPRLRCASSWTMTFWVDTVVGGPLAVEVTPAPANGTWFGSPETSLGLADFLAVEPMGTVEVNEPGWHTAELSQWKPGQMIIPPPPDVPSYCTSYFPCGPFPIPVVMLRSATTGGWAQISGYCRVSVVLSLDLSSLPACPPRHRVDHEPYLVVR